MTNMPPIVALSRTKNWSRGSLSSETITLRALVSYLKKMPGIPCEPVSRRSLASTQTVSARTTWTDCSPSKVLGPRLLNLAIYKVTSVLIQLLKSGHISRAALTAALLASSSAIAKTVHGLSIAAS